MLGVGISSTAGICSNVGSLVSSSSVRSISLLLGVSREMVGNPAVVAPGEVGILIEDLWSPFSPRSLAVLESDSSPMSMMLSMMRLAPLKMLDHLPGLSGCGGPRDTASGRMGTGDDAE